MLIELKNEIIYGPVNSRRLGSSLGINLLPSKIKFCNFNCVYCQYGWTDYKKIQSMNNISFPSVDQVGESVIKALKKLKSPPAFLTFSGNGEPTLHPEFDKIVDRIIEIRNEYSPSSKTAVLSNSTGAADEKIRTALAKLDERIMKLDAGSPDTFKIYNHPDRGVNLDEITNGLVMLNDVTIQSLFSSGSKGNYKSDNINDWIGRIEKINPKFVQLYSLVRDVPSKLISKLEKDDLSRIKTLLDKEKIYSEIY